MPDPPPRLATMLSLLFCLVAPPAAAAATMHYRVAADEQLEYFDVNACFEGSIPRRLIARNEDAADLLRAAYFEAGEQRVELEPRGAVLVMPRSGAPACVQYRVDLRGIGVLQWRSIAWRSRDAVVLDPGLWLWQPAKVAEKTRWLIEFELPPHYDVSAPWRRIGEAPDRVSYLAQDRMPGWDARVAVGRFSVGSVELPGGRLRYALLPGTPAPDGESVRRWITSAADALVSAHGRLPVPEVQLLLVPIGRGGEAVPWGEVQRGGGDAVHVYIDQRRPAQEFMADWVLVHELAHLLHPVIEASDRWLSEGIASYYQNVLRARAGMLSARSAWEELHAGFERGIRGTPRGRSLAEVSETMMRDHTFMRVYWSGAAIALLADVELRRRSGGAQSLDTALSAFSDCCLPTARSWSAREWMQQLDRLSGTTVFMELYRRYVDSDDFPDLGSLYAELGLQPLSETRLRLDPAAPGVEKRRAIMRAAED